jgi:hypothetical protein
MRHRSLDARMASTLEAEVAGRNPIATSKKRVNRAASRELDRTTPRCRKSMRRVGNTSRRSNDFLLGAICRRRRPRYVLHTAAQRTHATRALKLIALDKDRRFARDRSLVDSEGRRQAAVAVRVRGRVAQESRDPGRHDVTLPCTTSNDDASAAATVSDKSPRESDVAAPRTPAATRPSLVPVCGQDREYQYCPADQ